MRPPALLALTLGLSLLAPFALAQPAPASPPAAQAPAPSAPNAQPPAAKPITLFAWTVTAAGAPKPDLVIGTMHLPVPDDQPLPAPVEAALGSATRFVMETDTSEVTPEMLSRFTSLPAGQRLSHKLSKAGWQRLVKAAPLGLKPAALDHTQPWLLSMTLGMAGSELNEGEGTPMDERLRSQAQAANVPVGFLETAEAQFRMLNDVSDVEDIQQLEETLASPGRARREFETLVKAYRSGQLDRVEAVVLDPAQRQRYPDFFRQLLDRRNANWEAALAPILAEEDAVVAVGLGHVVGKEGLLARLARRGYTIQAVAP